jgi:hypothetical protein
MSPPKRPQQRSPSSLREVFDAPGSHPGERPEFILARRKAILKARVAVYMSPPKRPQQRSPSSLREVFDAPGSHPGERPEFILARRKAILKGEV